MSSYFLRLCRLAFTRLRYLCLLIFFRRFLITEPMRANLVSWVQNSLVEVRGERKHADNYMKSGGPGPALLFRLMKPVIGITSQPRSVENASGSLDSHLIGHTYTDSVLRAGGLPVSLIPVPNQDVSRVLDRVDGVVLSGGGDVEPHRYGQEAHDATWRTNFDRDEFELELIKQAHERRTPVLAICRGVQVVNVAFGGSLIQDIPSATGSMDHDVIGHAVYDGHQPVTIAADSKIAKATGETEMLVNSIHHQAIDVLADGFRPVAWADDGVIEGIEHDDEDWELLGVQWHPEFLGDNFDLPSQNLFDALVENARNYAGS